MAKFLKTTILLLFFSVGAQAQSPKAGGTGGSGWYPGYGAKGKAPPPSPTPTPAPSHSHSKAASKGPGFGAPKGVPPTSSSKGSSSSGTTSSPAPRTNVPIQSAARFRQLQFRGDKMPLAQKRRSCKSRRTQLQAFDFSNTALYRRYLKLCDSMNKKTAVTQKNKAVAPKKKLKPVSLDLKRVTPTPTPSSSGTKATGFLNFNKAVIATKGVIAVKGAKAKGSEKGASSEAFNKGRTLKKKTASKGIKGIKAANANKSTKAAGATATSNIPGGVTGTAGGLGGVTMSSPLLDQNSGFAQEGVVQGASVVEAQDFQEQMMNKAKANIMKAVQEDQDACDKHIAGTEPMQRGLHRNRCCDRALAESRMSLLPASFKDQLPPRLHYFAASYYKFPTKIDAQINGYSNLRFSLKATPTQFKLDLFKLKNFLGFLNNLYEKGKMYSNNEFNRRITSRWGKPGANSYIQEVIRKLKRDRDEVKKVIKNMNFDMGSQKAGGTLAGTFNQRNTEYNARLSKIKIACPGTPITDSAVGYGAGRRKGVATQPGGR